MKDGSKENLNSYKLRFLWKEAEFGDVYDEVVIEDKTFPEEFFISDDFLEFMFMLEQKYSTKIEYSKFEDYYEFFLSEAGFYEGAEELALEVLNEVISFFELQLN